MKRLLSLAILGVIAGSSYALPARLDLVIQALFENKDFEEAVQTLVGSATSPMGAAFEAVSIKSVPRTEEIRRSCGSAADSKSGTVLAVTFKKEKTKTIIHFATASAPEDLAVCNLK